MRVAFIGGGDRARDAVYPAFGDLAAAGKIEIAAVCHTDEKRRTEFAAAYNIKNVYGSGGKRDYQKMINEVKPDAVVFIGQPNVLFDEWIWCMEHGLHLFIEKPMGITYHEALLLEAAARRNKVVTQVAFQRGFSPLAQVLREKVAARGELTQVVCKFYKCEPFDYVRARDRMYDDAVHAIDTLRCLSGSEPVKIDSVCKRAGTTDINMIIAQIVFASGCTGVMMCNWASGKRLFSAEMHAPGIFAEFEHETKGFIYADGKLEPEVFDAKEVAGSDKFHVYTGVLACVEDFVDCCLNAAAGNTGAECRRSFSRSLPTMKIADYILAQAALNEGL